MLLVLLCKPLKSSSNRALLGELLSDRTLRREGACCFPLALKGSGPCWFLQEQLTSNLLANLANVPASCELLAYGAVLREYRGTLPGLFLACATGLWLVSITFGTQAFLEHTLLLTSSWMPSVISAAFVAALAPWSNPFAVWSPSGRVEYPACSDMSDCAASAFFCLRDSGW